jgi:type I restriction enzyme S subunit
MAANEWAPLRLGAVCSKIGSGATPRGGSDVYLQKGPYALIRSQNVYNDGFHCDGLAFIGEQHAAELENVEVLKGDVLLNITGDSVARACQVDSRVLPARVNQHVTIIRPDPEKLDPRFLRYFLVSPEMQTKLLSWAGSGGTRNALTKGMIESFNVVSPTNISEQCAIAHILGTLDDKIELNRRMNETLEAIARAIFKSWFVDFDPVRAKTEGRDPGLPKHIADLFPDSFEDSELGSIPNGWEVRTVGDLAEVSSGSRPNVRYDEALPEAYVPLWGGNGPMAFVPEPLIDYPILLTGRVGTLGSVFRITSPCWPSDNTLILRARQSRAFDYLFLQLKRVDFSSLNRGSTQPLLTQTDLKSQFVVLPPTAVLERFHAFAKELYERIDASESESRTLAALRDSLLPKLISGEMRVKGADILLEAKG